MKILKTILVILAVGFFFNSCSPGTDHSMRVKNEHDETLLDLKIEDVNYGDISPGEVTDYKSIEVGQNEVTAIIEEMEDEFNG